MRTLCGDGLLDTITSQPLPDPGTLAELTHDTSLKTALRESKLLDVVRVRRRISLQTPFDSKVLAAFFENPTCEGAGEHDVTRYAPGYASVVQMLERCITARQKRVVGISFSGN